MMMSRFQFLSCFLILLSLCACSSTSKATKDADIAAALPLMVIDQTTFEREHLKYCTHTRECTAPLACIEQKCSIPPSLLGRPNEKTNQLKFQTESAEHQIWIEIMDDDYTMQRGMMMRRAFHPDWGMLFVYPNEAKRSFWMHNTYIPLDMVFIRSDGTVSNTRENAEPLNDQPRYTSTDRVKYVLELPAGSVKKYGINTKTKFSF